MKNFREEMSSRIVAAIEAGTPPWRKGWSGGELCFNAQTSKAYQGLNQLLLGMSGFDDPRWLTFKQSRKMGLHVRKGERSTKIVRMVEVERNAVDREKDGEVVAEEQGKALVMRLYDVFNGSQIEGMAPRTERAHSIEPVDAVEAMVEGMKRTGLTIRHGFPGASYSVSDDLIRMPNKASFHGTANYDYFATLLHEMSHSTGSHKRLQRLIPTARFGSQEYAKEELRAEIASAMLCAEVGIGQAQEHLDNHAAYIASWLEVLKQDKNEIFRAAADAQRACDFIREHAIKVQPKAAPETTAVAPRPVEAQRRRPRLG